MLQNLAALRPIGWCRKPKVVSSCFCLSHRIAWVIKSRKGDHYLQIWGEFQAFDLKPFWNTAVSPPPFVGIRRQQNKSLAYDASHMHLLTNHFSRRLQLKRHLICGGFSYLYYSCNKITTTQIQISRQNCNGCNKIVFESAMGLIN